MKLNIFNDTFIYEELPHNEVNAHCRYTPEKFLWSNDAKQLPAIPKHVGSLIIKLSDVMIIAGNKSLKRHSYEPKRKNINKVN